MIHQWLTKTDRKKVTICDSDNPFLILSKRHLFTLSFRQQHLYFIEIATATFVPYQTSDRWVGKQVTKQHQNHPWNASLPN